MSQKDNEEINKKKRINNPRRNLRLETSKQRGMDSKTVAYLDSATLLARAGS